MGLEVIAAGTALAVGTAYQVERGMSASREQKRARKVSAAQQENERQAAIRQQMRQERVRRAQIMSAAEASGVSGSSLETSTIGSGQTITSAGQAFATGASLSNQRVAKLESQAQFDLAQGQLGGAVASLGTSAFTSGLIKPGG